MTELSDTSRIAPGALEAWQRHLGREIDAGTLRCNGCNPKGSGLRIVLGIML